MFEFLFKFRPLVFERGELSLGIPGWWLVLALISLALIVPFVLRYRDPVGETRAADRVVLAALRISALGVLLVCLFRPTLLVSTVIPQRNFVAVLVDDSRSMRITDVDGESRAAFAYRLLGGGEEDPAGPDDATAAATEDSVVLPSSDEIGGLRRALEDRFRVRTYGFASDARRVDGFSELGFDGQRTSLAAALERVQQEMAGLPLSGVVLVSDGADNAERSLTDPLLELQAASIPVYAVGVGRERIRPDIEVRRAETPRSVLEGSTLVADVIIAHAGYEGTRVRLDVEDGGRIIGSREVDLPADGDMPIQLQFTVEEAGPRRLQFRVRPQEGEAVLENNVREVLLEVRDRREKILYIEGEPRYEIKFVRRAVADDPNLQVVVLIRTADEKFLRLDVDDGEELAGGFPRTRQELFEYSGLVLGSIEASFFTHDQLQMMADFVATRGGGLLALGGRRSLAEGGYAGTSLADALPVTLEAPDGEDPFAELQVEITPAGRRHPALRISENEESSAERWSLLPPVTSANRLTGLKAGAVTLLSGESPGERDPRIVMAYQRFGRGKAIAFAVQDSWMWQMHADIPLEDTTHETLWRQLLRWLVSDVPGRIRVTPSEELVHPGETIELTAQVEDERYLSLNGARVQARIIDPTGIEQLVPMEWTVDRDGEYRAAFQPMEPGLHQVVVEPEADSGAVSGVAPGATFFRSGPAAREQFEAAMRAPVLERIAEETGGRFYTTDDVAGLAEDIRYTETGNTVIEEKELWDMPFLFLLLLGLVGAEWGFRRWRGLA